MRVMLCASCKLLLMVSQVIGSTLEIITISGILLGFPFFLRSHLVND